MAKKMELVDTTYRRFVTNQCVAAFFFMRFQSLVITCVSVYF